MRRSETRRREKQRVSTNEQGGQRRKGMFEVKSGEYACHITEKSRPEIRVEFAERGRRGGENERFGRTKSYDSRAEKALQKRRLREKERDQGRKTPRKTTSIHRKRRRPTHRTGTTFSCRREERVKTAREKEPERSKPKLWGRRNSEKNKKES